MDAKLRIVTNLPLQELWRDDGFSTTARKRGLNEEGITKLLASGPVQFVVVDVGAAPRWIPASECFHFWRNEVKSHLAIGEGVFLQAFPGNYCYFASAWDSRESVVPIVVLEKPLTDATQTT